MGRRRTSLARETVARSIAATLLLAVALLLVAAPGCTPDFDKPELIKDLRILALRASPPEVLVAPGPITTVPRVRVDALVVDPRKAADAELTWRVVVCSAEENECDEAATSKELIAPRRGRLDAIAFDVQLDAAFIAQAIAADPFRGFGGVPVLVELHVEDPNGPEVVGVKRLVFGFTDPPKKIANKNPVLESIKVADKPIAPMLTVKAGQKIVLLPAVEKASKEKYLVRTFTGGEETLDEFITYHYFTTDGELSHQRTGGKPSPFVENKKVDDVTSEWTAPEADKIKVGSGTLYIVARDDRGGVTWRLVPYRVE